MRLIPIMFLRRREFVVEIEQVSLVESGLMLSVERGQLSSVESGQTCSVDLDVDGYLES